MADHRVPNSAMQEMRLHALAAHGDQEVLRHCFTLGLDLCGEVEPSVLSAGLDALVQRHPALRAEFPATGGEHVIRSDVKASLERRIVVGPDAATRWRNALAYADEDSRRPFDIGAAPLLRATLLEIDWRRSLLVLSFDHLVMDAWSSTLVVEELVRQCEMAARGQPNQVTESTAYMDSRRRSEKWLRSDTGLRAAQVRREQLHGYRDRLPVARPVDDSTAGALVTRLVVVPDAVATALAGHARRLRSGLFATVLAGFAVTFGDRLAGPGCVYSTFACREDRAEETAIGAVSNRVVLRLPASDVTVARYVAELRAELTKALDTQRLPSWYPDGGPVDRVGDGLSVSIQFLPAQLIGGGQYEPATIGDAEVRLHSVSMCPSGVDVDLYVLDRPVIEGHSRQPLLALTAVAAESVGTEQLEALLARWVTALDVLSEAEWDETTLLDACGAARERYAPGEPDLAGPAPAGHGERP